MGARDAYPAWLECDLPSAFSVRRLNWSRRTAMHVVARTLSVTERVKNGTAAFLEKSE